MTQSIFFFDTKCGEYFGKSIWLKACRNRETGKIRRFQRFCDDAIAMAMKYLRLPTFINERNHTGEPSAFIRFCFHTIEEIGDPFFIGSYSTRPPTTGVNAKFILERFDQNPGIIGNGEDS